MSLLKVDTIRDVLGNLFGMNKYIMGVHASNAVTASATDFSSWTASLGSPACAQFNTSTGNYTAPETGFYEFHVLLSLGNVTVRTMIGLKKNGVHSQEIIDATNQPYGDFGMTQIVYLTAGDTIRPWVGYASGATSATCFFSCKMVGK